MLQHAGLLLSNQLQVGQTPDPEQFVADFLARTEHLFEQIWQLCNEEEQTLLILIALLALKGSWQNQEYQLGDLDFNFQSARAGIGRFGKARGYYKYGGRKEKKFILLLLL